MTVAISLSDDKLAKITPDHIIVQARPKIEYAYAALLLSVKVGERAKQRQAAANARPPQVSKK